MSGEKSLGQLPGKRYKKKSEKRKLILNFNLLSFVSFFLLLFIAYTALYFFDITKKSYAIEMNLLPAHVSDEQFNQLGTPLNIYVDQDGSYWWNYDDVSGSTPQLLVDNSSYGVGTFNNDYPEMRALFNEHIEKYKNLLVVIVVNRDSEVKHFINVIDEFDLTSNEYMKRESKKIPIRYTIRRWSDQDSLLVFKSKK